MIKKERRTNDDKFFKLESKRNKHQGKKQESFIEDEPIISDPNMSATELAEYYEYLED